jgi:hypothetical protein
MPLGAQCGDPTVYLAEELVGLLRVVDRLIGVGVVDYHHPGA